MQTFDAAVIGGGMAGLIAAIELAQADKKVILLEKANKAGGRANTIKKNGALFNLGGHALYKEGEAYAILQAYGLRLTGDSPKTDGKAIWQNRIVPLPGTPLSLLATRLLGWRGKVELGKLVMTLSSIRAQEIGRISLREWAEQTVRDPMVRHIVYALFRLSTYCKDIDFQLAGPAIQQLQRALRSGVLYLDGGWQTIVDQLLEKARELGVTILKQANVCEITQVNGAVSGVRLADGKLIPVNYVIAAVPPAEISKLMHGAEPSALRRWKDEARPITAACLDLCLKRLPTAELHFAIGIDQPVYFSNHSRVSKLTNDGTMVVHVIKYNDARGRHPKADEQLLEQTMDLLHSGWRQEVVARQYLPSMTVTYDYAHIGRTAANIGPEVPDMAGLYVAGDWAGHDELLADAAAASAIRAAAALLSHDARKPQRRDVYHVI